MSISIRRRKKHKQWMKLEILELMIERRRVKSTVAAYKNLDREVRNVRKLKN